MKNQIIIIICLFQFMIFNNLTAQSIVIINGEPTKVIIDNAEIVRVLPDDVKNYMAEFDTTTPPNESFKAIPIKDRQSIILDRVKSECIFTQKETEE